MFEQVRDIFVEMFEADPDSITPETHLFDDLGADSLDAVELIVTLEENYQVSISDEDAAQLVTVGKIVEYLESLNV